MRVARLLIDERIRADGAHTRTWLALDGATLQLTDDDEAIGSISIAALDAVMVRYGRPLEPDLALVGPTLDFTDHRCLRRLHFHAIVDAEGRDYLVWERVGHEPLAVIATTATAALRHLAIRLGPRATSDS